MPRQSRSSRPAPRPAPAQSRGAHTVAAPPATRPAAQPPMVAQPGQPKQPGMMAQMAATAGSVAVGSTIGHGLSSMLFGGGSREASAAVPESYPVQNQTQQSYSGATCDLQAKDFTKCLETGDVTTCGWYLEQLRACQAAAAPY